MQALDDKVSHNRVIIQAPGAASIIEGGRLREASDAIPELRALLIKYEQFFLAQVPNRPPLAMRRTTFMRECADGFSECTTLPVSICPLPRNFSRK